MFESARIQLTFLYLAFIVLITSLYSAAFYRVTNRELQRIIDRVTIEQNRPDTSVRPMMRVWVGPTIDELIEAKKRFRMNLLITNAAIIMVSGAASYFLAGKTLKPIQKMLENQHTFVTNASHELRTPIATIQAEVETALMDPKLTLSQSKKVLSSTLEEVASLKNLVNTLLNLSVTTQKIQPLQRVQLETCAANALKKTAPLAKKKKITLLSKIEPATILGSSKGITDLIVILIDNAIKYSPTESTITTQTRRTKKTVTLTVSDQGPGIAPSELPHIFERFYRADATRNQSEGYGLGLSIAQKIVAEHQGTISVSSQEKIGTTFTIRLPLSK